MSSVDQSELPTGGLLGGSVSYTRFYLRIGRLEADDATSGDFGDRLERAVAHHTFRPLVAEEEEDERVGWCSVRDPFVLELDRNEFLYADHVHLGLRIDRWRVPRNIFKAQYAIASRELMDQQGIHRLSRAQKEDLQVFVMRRLRKQTIPVLRHVDLSWELATGLVRVASTSRTVLDHARLQFEKTFKVDLVEHGVFTAMHRAGLDDQALSQLVALQPARLHTQDGA